MSLLNSKCALIFIIALSHLIPLSGPSVLYGEITNSDPLIIPDKDEDVPGAVSYTHLTLPTICSV